MKKKNTGKNGLSNDELVSALYSVYDLFDRLNTPFFLLGETAKAAVEGIHLEGDTLYVGTRDVELIPDRLNWLKTFEPTTEIGDDEIKYKQKVDTTGADVNVVIKRVKRSYEFIKNPDQVVYMHETWKIPNQFDKYWKVRAILR